MRRPHNSFFISAGLLLLLLIMETTIQEASAFKHRKRRDDCIALAANDITSYNPSVGFKTLQKNMYGPIKRFEGYLRSEEGWQVTSGEKLPSEEYLKINLGEKGDYENMFRVMNKGEEPNENWFWIDSDQTCFILGHSMDKVDRIDIRSYPPPLADPLKGYRTIHHLGE